MRRLGLIVNPIAGMGGAVGLKGTDGAKLLERARELGAVAQSGKRAESALRALSQPGRDLEILTYAGAMGEAAAVSCGMEPTVIGSAASPTSTPSDTRAAARDLVSRGIDLLLFAGGDGTARDIHDAVGESVTALGIPAGVKIQSAVFATGPVVAGKVADLVLDGGLIRTKQAEVMDIDEELYRQGQLSSRLYGYLRIPDASHRLQSRKSSTAPSERSVQQAIAEELRERLSDERFHIIGPGTTCGYLMEMLGLEHSLLGIDIIRAQRLVGKDLREQEILETVGETDCSLVITPIGGQGFLLGRGNQQLSPRVVRKVGRENIVVVATNEKLSALGGRPLLVDTGDTDCDSYLSGYYRIVTGYRETTVYKVAGGS